MEQLIGVAVLLVLSALSSWLQNRRSGDSQKEPAPATPERSKWEELLRNLTDQDAWKSPPPVAGPTTPPRSATQMPATSKKEAQLARQPTHQRSTSRLPTQPTSSSASRLPAAPSTPILVATISTPPRQTTRAEDSAAAATRRAEHSQAEAVKLAKRLRQKADQRSTAGKSTVLAGNSAKHGKQLSGPRAVRSWLSSPAKARQAILATSILNPPKALE